MNKPDIKTAIPVRRYQYGEFIVVVLGDIESGDANRYRYIAAVMREGEAEPGMYLTAERNLSSPEEGRYAMRLVMNDGAQVVRRSDDWDREEAFTLEALDIVSQVLNLGDEEPYRMM